MRNDISNSQAGRNHEEFVNESQTKVIFVPPSSIVRAELLTEQVQNVSGWKRPGGETVTQQSGQALRHYLDTNIDKTFELTVTLNMNLNDANQNYIYNTICDWANLYFNPETGVYGKKKNAIGEILMQNYDNEGNIYWERRCYNAFIKGEIASIGQHDVTNSEPSQLEITFQCDGSKEVRN